MKSSFIKLIFILLLLTQASFEQVTPESKKKGSRGISFQDLKDISVGLDDIKNEDIVYESESSSSNTTLKSQIQEQYPDVKYQVLYLDDLIGLVDKGIISEDQATQMWGSLYKQKQTNASSMENPVTAFVNKTYYRAKEMLGDFPMLIIFWVIFIILYMVFAYLGFEFYRKQQYGSLVILSVIFVYNFYFASRLISSQTNAPIFLACIYNSLFMAAVVLVHCLVCLTGTQTDLKEWKELVNPEFNFAGKLGVGTFSLLAGYLTAHQCDHPFAQSPFYLAIVYLVCMVGSKLHEYTPYIVQPFWVIVISALAILLFAYCYQYGDEAFILPYSIREQINTTLRFDLIRVVPNMQYMGYATSTTILVFFMPFYPLVQWFDSDREYFKKTFSYIALYHKIKKHQTKAVLSDKNELNSTPFLVYGMSMLMGIIIGFQLRMYYMIYMSTLGLLFFNSVYTKVNAVSAYIFFYISGILAINAIFCMGQLNDPNGIKVWGESRTGYPLYFAEFLLRLIPNYFAYQLCTANLMYTENKTITTLFELAIFLVKFFINYLFSVFLAVLAKLEQSTLHSIIYSILSIIFLGRILKYSTSSDNDKVSRLMISGSTFWCGLRMAMLSSTAALPYYFGVLLIHFGIFTTYMNFANILAMPLSAFFIYGMVNYTHDEQNWAMVCLLIFNLCGFVATRISKVKESMLRIFFLFMIINFVVFAMGRFRLDIYYNFCEWFKQTLGVGFMDSMWDSLLDKTYITEEGLSKNIVSGFMSTFGIEYVEPPEVINIPMSMVQQN